MNTNGDVYRRFQLTKKNHDFFSLSLNTFLNLSSFRPDYVAAVRRTAVEIIIVLMIIFCRIKRCMRRVISVTTGLSKAPDCIEFLLVFFCNRFLFVRCDRKSPNDIVFLHQRLVC